MTLFEQALEHHRAGRLNQAGPLYERFLAQQPNHPDALHLLGLAHHQSNRPQQAIELILRAIQIHPHNPAYFINLGEALRVSGQPARALEAYGEALRLDPQSADAHANRASALRMLGRIDEAIAAAEAALELNPDHASANLSLGMSLVEREPARAMHHLERAVQLNPANPAPRSNLALVLSSQGRHDQAVEQARRAVELAPANPVVLVNLAHVLGAKGDHADALEAARRALAIDAKFAPAHAHASVALDHLNRLEEALGEHETAYPEPPDARQWINRGVLLTKLARPEEALGSFERALQIEPTNVEAHFCRALALMALGRLAEGFEEYRYRWQYELFLKSNRRTLTNPWAGQAFAPGDSILLLAEQGIGDTIQFVRYATLLANRGARVMVACRPILFEIVLTCRGVSEVYDLDAPLPEATYQANLLDLPLHLSPSMKSLPADVPYLSAKAENVAHFGDLLKDARGKRVGLCWAGSAHHPDDRMRSIPPKLLAPLGEVEGVSLVSLQKEAGERPGLALLDFGGELRDFSDTAALVESLDLVITVDTSVAHLAGALGKPTWVMIATASDWRWFHGRTDSPWYPTVKLFRQRRPAEWGDVVAAVSGELRNRLKVAEAGVVRRVAPRPRKEGR
ncbi:MAG TPA: tetratricopeptide repeat protein [Tepidisphaeraceae bacterium]